MNQNCHNSRTSNDIDMKLRVLSKLENRNIVTSKKFDNYFVSANCGGIIIF